MVRAAFWFLAVRCRCQPVSEEWCLVVERVGGDVGQTQGRLGRCAAIAIVYSLEERLYGLNREVASEQGQE